MKLFRLYNEQTEAIVQRCSVKKAPSKILQKPQEKTRPRTSLLMKPKA